MTEPVSPAILVLIGAPGAGKSRIGKRIAKLLGVEFIDTDKSVVAEHGSIPSIFELHGEPRFRELERIAVANALHHPAVIALGGGAVLDEGTQRDLERVRVVQLWITPEAVESRIGGEKRPLLTDGITAWTELVAARQPIYDRLADKTFDTSTYPAEKIAANIAAWIQENDK